MKSSQNDRRNVWVPTWFLSEKRERKFRMRIQTCMCLRSWSKWAIDGKIYLILKGKNIKTKLTLIRYVIERSLRSSKKKLMDWTWRKINEVRTESHENRNHQCKSSITFPQKDRNKKLTMMNIQLLLLSSESSQRKIQARRIEDKNQKYRRADKDPVLLKINLIFLFQLTDINTRFENEDFQAFTTQKSHFKNPCPCSVVRKCPSPSKENSHFLTLFIPCQKSNNHSKSFNLCRSATMF